MDERELASCSGKEAFDNRLRAEAVQKRRAKDGKFAQSQVYRCKFCRSWHIGYKKPELNKKALRRFMARYDNDWRR